MMRFLFTLIAALVFFTRISAQTEQQSAYWTRLYAQISGSAPWEIHLEADERKEWGTNEHLQFITHASARRRLNTKWSVAPGASYSTVTGVPEYRLFQEAHTQWPLWSKWSIQQRIRVEERWFDQPNRANLRFRFRMRYRLQLNYSPWAWGLFKLSEEYLFHTDAFDQNRVYAAFEGRFSQKIAIEMGYLFIYQKRSSNTLASDIWRTTLLVRL